MPVVFCDYDDCEDSFFISPVTLKECENVYCADHRKSATEVDKTDEPFRTNMVGVPVSLVHDEGEESLGEVHVKCVNEIQGTITIGETPPATPDEKLEEGAETYESKNEDYGESWRQAGEILWKLADEDITVESEEEAIQLGLYFQRLHKLTRGFNGDFGVAELNNEPTTDSHEDEMIYSAMAATISEEI